MSMMREAVQDTVTIDQASSDEGMQQLFSDRIIQKMANLSNVSDMQKSSTANGTDMFVKGQIAVQCHPKTHNIFRKNVHFTNSQWFQRMFGRKSNLATACMHILCFLPICFSPFFIIHIYQCHEYNGIAMSFYCCL